MKLSLSSLARAFSRTIEAGVRADFTPELGDRVRLTNLVTVGFICLGLILVGGLSTYEQTAAAVGGLVAIALLFGVLGFQRRERQTTAAVLLWLATTVSATALTVAYDAGSYLAVLHLACLCLPFVALPLNKKSYAAGLAAATVIVHGVALVATSSTTTTSDLLFRVVGLGALSFSATLLYIGFAAQGRSASRHKTMVRSMRMQLIERKDVEHRLRDALAQSRAADNAKNAFLGAVSHELRTPLNGVLGLTQLLLESRLDADQRDLAMTIDTSGRYLLRVLNDVLEYARLGRGQVQLKREVVDLAEFVHDVVDQHLDEARLKGLMVHLDVDMSPLRRVMTDGGRLDQILTALLANAIKFTEAGHVLIRTTLEEEDDRVIFDLEVSDTGVGIPEDKLRHVFDAFAMGDDTLARARGGTGLGLAIIHEVIRALGGTIECDSIPGQGTTFRVHLTLDRSTAAPLESPTPLSGLAIALFSNLHIDDAALVPYLRGLGARVARYIDLDRDPSTLTSGRRRILLLDEGVIPTDDNLPWAVALAERWNIEMRDMFVLSRDARHDIAGLQALQRPVRADSLTRLQRRYRNPAVAHAPQQGGTSISRGGLKVLIAEDNPVNSMLLCRLLDGLGVESEVVANGKLAVQRARQTHWDLVLMDLQMPEMDGITATRVLRGLSGPVSNIPIIAVTANAGPEERQQGAEAGINEFLEKPLDKERLTAALNRFGRHRTTTSANTYGVPAES